MVSLKLFIGGMAVAAVLGGAIGTGASALVVPRVIGQTVGPSGPPGPAGPPGATGLTGAQGSAGLQAPALNYQFTCTTDTQGPPALSNPVVTGSRQTCFLGTCTTSLIVGYLETSCSVRP
jgi:hypothetical protein